MPISIGRKPPAKRANDLYHMNLKQIPAMLTTRLHMIGFLNERFKRYLVYEEIGRLTIYLPRPPFPETWLLVGNCAPGGMLIEWRRLSFWLCRFRRRRWIDDTGEYPKEIPA